MDFLGFTLGVWASIALGVFFLLMVLACTEDRRNREGFKWAVFFVGLIAFVIGAVRVACWSTRRTGKPVRHLTLQTPMVGWVDRLSTPPRGQH